MPFLKAGSSGTVRPQNTKAKESQEERGRTTSARTVVLPLTRLRESVRTHSMLMHIDLSDHCFQDRSAKQRGKVAHTARPGQTREMTTTTSLR